jgi:hypothetical protein
MFTASLCLALSALFGLALTLKRFMGLVNRRTVTKVTLLNLVTSSILLAFEGGTNPLIVLGLIMPMVALPITLDNILKDNMKMFVRYAIFPVAVMVIGIINLWLTGYEPIALTLFFALGLGVVLNTVGSRARAENAIAVARQVYFEI